MAEPFVLDKSRARDGTPDVRIAPGDELPDAATLQGVPIVGVLFPGFRDGRGYSTARMLRERGYEGDIRAIGDVTVDQLFFLLRAGFSSLEPDRPIDPRRAADALARFPFVYQRAADGRVPAFELRHGHVSACA